MEHDRNLAPHTKSVSAPAGPTRWGKILNPTTIATHLFLPTTSTAMIERSDLSSSNRSLSASSLKDRLSKLSVTPLRPVAALQARVKCVHSIPARLVIFFAAGLSPLNSHPPLCLQFCPSEHPSGTSAPDRLGCIMDQHDSGLRGPDPIPPVRPFLDPVVSMATATTDILQRRWHAARTHLCGHS